MSVDFTVIMAACNAGPLLFETIDSIRNSCNPANCELIVVDDCSTDAVCQSLPSNITVLQAPQRLGASGAKHLGCLAATTDVLILTDPHCSFPRGAVEHLALAAYASPTIVQPQVQLEGKPRYRGSVLSITPEGIKERCVRYLPPVPIMHGSIYAMSRRTWEAIGRYSPLPGYWWYEEFFNSAVAYRLGYGVTTLNFSCTHRRYRRAGQTPYYLPPETRARNAHWCHAVLLPDHYEQRFSTLLNQSLPYDTSEDFATERFKALQERVRSLAYYDEAWFVTHIVTGDKSLLRSEA